jgi:phenylacetate-CoA ligase
MVKIVRQIDERLRDLIEHAYANAAATQARFDKVGLVPDDIRGVADLQKLPILSKDAVIALQQANPPFGGLLAVPMNQVDHIFFSPGPLYEPGPPEDDSAWEMGMYSLRQAGFQPGEVVLNSLAYHLVPAGYYLDMALAKYGCTVIPGGTGSSDLQLKMAVDLRATGYTGTGSFLMALIQKAQEAGLAFGKQFCINKAVLSAEPLPTALRREIESHGIAVANAYATAEFGIMAIDTMGNMQMQLCPDPIIQIVDPETGQEVASGAPGEVVVTNFNRHYPLIRFGTGDMAINIDPNPGQSRQEERFITLVGRSGEAAKVRGMFVHPNQLRFVAGQIPGVQAVQGVVSRPDRHKDHFTLRVAVADGVDETAVADALKQAVQSVCRVRVDKLEFVSSGMITADSPGMIDERDWS